MIDIDEQRAEKIGPILSWAGLELIHFQPQDANIYDLVREQQPEIILIDTNSSNRDTLEHLAQLDNRGARTVISLGKKKSESINRLAADVGISLYAIDAVPNHLLQSLIDVTISYFHSLDKLREEVSLIRPLLEERKALYSAVQFIMKTYGLAEEQAQDLLYKNAKHQQRSVSELAKHLVSTGSLA